MDHESKKGSFRHSAGPDVGGMVASGRPQARSDRAWGNRGHMSSTAYAWCRSQGTGIMIGRLSGRRTVVGIV